MKNNKKDTIIALRKARSSLDKIIKMVDQNEYCIDIIQQILAVNGLLKSASSKVLKSHLETCFKNAMKSKNKVLQEKMIEEILQVNKLSSR